MNVVECAISSGARLAGLTVYGCGTHRCTFTVTDEREPSECPSARVLRARARPVLKREGGGEEW